MSTTAPADIAPIPLNQKQADAILKYGIEHRMYEDPAGGIESVDPQTRLNDAATLAFQARRAWAAGNHREEAKDILFIAEVDMNPPDTAVPVAPPVPGAEVPAVAAPPAAPADANGADPYPGNTDEQLQQALAVFQTAPTSPAIQAEIEKIQAVINQRSGQPAQAAPPVQPAQEVAPAPQPPAPAPAPGPVPEQPAGGGPPVPSAGPPAGPAAPPQLPPAPAVAPPEPHVAPQYVDQLPPVPGRPNPGVISAGGQPDAGDVAGAQAAQPPAQGVAPAPAPAPAGGQDRAWLIGNLTLSMLQAWNLTMEQAQGLEDGQLRYILANPGGPTATPAPATPDAAAQQGRQVSPDRLKLEEQVTGPMLKAWGRGRQEVATGAIGDQLLALMVANPTRQGVTDEQINQAVALDSGGQPAGAPPSPEVSQAATPVETPPVAPAPAPLPAPEPAAAAPAPPAAESVPSAAAQPPVPASPAPQVTPPQQGPVAPVLTTTSSEGVAAAMDIIAREHLPIPPDMEQAYRLPNDVSKSSDTDLWSLHAQAHATEARCNWIISERDDVADDYAKLIADAKRRAEDELPETEEGKKLTKVRKEELINGNAEVVVLEAQLKDYTKGTNKIKVIRDNAHRDCERLSRQWSFRHREEMGSPTR